MSMDDFASALEASFDNLVTKFEPGQKVKGTVVSISKNAVFIDVKSTSEGVINRDELLNKDGEISVSVGDEIEAFYLNSADGGINLTVKMTGAVNSAQLDEAFASGIPVVGKVLEERKGGFSVNIAGEKAFCPYSQMSLHRVEDTSVFVGNSYSFNISEYNSNNLVVSRKKILNEERKEKRKELESSLNPGDIISGIVSKVFDFGVFVDLDGVDGFIPMSEISWSRSDSALDYMAPGDNVTVQVKNLDWENDKITLSFRSAQTPWSSITEKFPIGSTTVATITRLESFGAFAQLEKGIEGLIHISKFGTGKRINHPREVVSVGDKVEVVIDKIDDETQRIALSRSVTGQNITDEATPVKASTLPDTAVIEAGSAIKGVVDGVTDFGVFVKLTASKSGLLHVSQAGVKNNSHNAKQVLSSKFSIGADIEVVVQKVEGDRISLTTLDKYNDEIERASQPTNHSDSKGSDLGSLGGMFDDLDL